jgi:hypothetical protein
MPSESEKMDSKTKSCPECGRQKGLRRILYGLPDGPPDPSFYRLGGCCGDENDPEFTCIACGWEGSFNDDEEEYDE